MTSSTSAAADLEELRRFALDLEDRHLHGKRANIDDAFKWNQVVRIIGKLAALEAQQTDDTLSGLRTVTMANQYKGKELWEVQIGGETAYYVGTLEEVIEKAKTHENYLHDEPLRGKPKPDQWNAGYPIGKIEKVGTLAG